MRYLMVLNNHLIFNCIFLALKLVQEQGKLILKIFRKDKHIDDSCFAPLLTVGAFTTRIFAPLAAEGEGR